MSENKLPWNSNAKAIPIDKPVLVRQRGHAVPFMGIRNADYEPDAVSYLLGPNESAYGIYVDVIDIEAWLDVNEDHKA